MANIKFCHPNWTLPTSFYSPTFTGDGWIDLPNLQGEVLSEMARYPGIDPARTKLVLDLATQREAMVFALPFHNAKPGDRARMRFATDPGMTNVVLDTGFKEFFGEVYPFGSLAWGRPEWIDGRLTPEQAVGKTPPWIHISPVSVLGQYLELTLDFSGNSDAYIDLGQIVISPTITPRYNLSYGGNPPFYHDPSTKARAKGGPQFADKSRPYRTARMQLDWLASDEVYGSFFEMVRDYGVTKPFFYIHDSDAPAAILPKDSFMATAESIGNPTHTSFNAYSLSIEISEAF